MTHLFLTFRTTKKLITTQKTSNVKCEYFLVCDWMGAALYVRVPAWLVWLSVRVSTHEPGGRWFDSQPEHIPRLWA